MIEVAAKHGVSPNQIGLIWILINLGVTTPIIGASKMNPLKKAVAALEIELDDDEQNYLEELYESGSILGYS